MFINIIIHYLYDKLNKYVLIMTAQKLIKYFNKKGVIEND